MNINFTRIMKPTLTEAQQMHKEWLKHFQKRHFMVTSNSDEFVPMTHFKHQVLDDERFFDNVDLRLAKQAIEDGNFAEGFAIIKELKKNSPFGDLVEYSDILLTQNSEKIDKYKQKFIKSAEKALEKKEYTKAANIMLSLGKIFGAMEQISDAYRDFGNKTYSYVRELYEKGDIAGVIKILNEMYEVSGGDKAVKKFAKDLNLVRNAGLGYMQK